MTAARPSRQIAIVELLGFPPSQVELFASTLAAPPDEHFAPDTPFIYRVVAGGGEIADAFIVNADNVHAMVALQLRKPDNARPALLIGQHGWELPWPVLDPGWVWSQLVHVLNRSMMAALELRQAFGGHRPKGDRWPHVDRRRRGRLDLDLTEPEVYAAMRRAAPRPA